MLSAVASAKITDPHKLVGSTIADKYAIEAVIDRGGYGMVYRAFHEVLRVPVALKFFTGLAQTEPERREELLERFAQEGALLTSLSTRSANIVQARDIGTLTTEDGVFMPYLVLEWLEGQSLERLLHGSASPARGRPRDWMDAFFLLDGVARALAIAHAAGVAHRDIKPGNFFVMGEDLHPGVIIKLLDFGIAKVMPADMGQTQGISNEFTPVYGAPEQFDRIHGATGPWTDVFGFALVMLELVRGGARVYQEHEFIALAQLCQDPTRRPTPRALGIEASDAVEEVFSRAVSVKVSERFENMAAFWNALGSALEVRDFLPVVADHRVAIAVGEARAGASLRGRIDASVRVPAAGSSGGLRGPANGPGGSGARLLAVEPGRVSPVAGRNEPGGMPTRLESDGRARPGRRLALTLGIVAAGLTCAAVVTVSMWRGGDDTTTPETPAVTGPETPDRAAAGTLATPGTRAAGRCPEGMALIPGGKFFMGSDNVDSPALHSARPAHRAEVEDFCMDIHEVTVAQHAACSSTGECKRAHRNSFWPQGKSDKKNWEASRAAYSPLCNEGQEGRERHPANCVTWEQADHFCRAHDKRLPSETEWEFAARGPDGRLYPWGDDPPDAVHLNGCGRECVAWRAAAKLPEVPVLYDADDGHPGTAAVGSFPAGKTRDGLLDLVGNVFEWTADDFQAYPGAPAGAPVAAGAKVMRGGGFNSSQAEHAEPSLRFPQDATAHVHAVGFRCARAPLRSGS